ncbi:MULTISPECIES: F0F1 ATP synthase subunit B [Chlorobium/Pelodictyon group]|uniref:ATP synthase subunit b 1 n=1 Tax=Chlorobium luteolum (strain DSM 273 / BCRC 81028 / 2530) TaxID=319225 RepID=ATPF1_CHLL3|nr:MULTISPECIES: F0F1 ATP synthase subunit B [Chlorobium/Pelodictyon group]Q3B400.1 RecName: Full=ATP synthase subunit b 1; AltName: Full=ATP synthase F(0) sector subunit b 1; AltName: Full=ATPase subunit I 1; AltName: Full=F-type ATPase subunit b 1; Short=F-ATPase subunit b 1 [Pelodictyon luteolum DSM 273]ABB23931.1 ATP synthase F0 subcomplex B subunit [Pelodictyon luteolum DSM 273]TCD47407.1 ATP synthase subunit b 1 [Chlorobium sp. N1]
MLFDWFTFWAQLLNFLILVWLLKRFLYRPVLEAIDEREKKISGELRDADEGRKQAEQAIREWQEKMSRLDAQAAGMLETARKEAGEEKKRLQGEARREYDELRGRLRESLHEEQAALGRTIAGRIRAEVFRVSDSVLNSLADSGLQAQMARAFSGRLSEGGTEVEELLKSGGTPLVLRSGFEMGEEEKELVRKTLADRFGYKGRLDFMTEESYRGGIALEQGGRSIEWSVNSRLEAIDEASSALLDGPDDEMNEEEGHAGKDAD